jgi:hypothetical protein
LSPSTISGFKIETRVFPDIVENVDIHSESPSIRPWQLSGAKIMITEKTYSSTKKATAFS